MSTEWDEELSAEMLEAAATADRLLEMEAVVNLPLPPDVVEDAEELSRDYDPLEGTSSRFVHSLVPFSAAFSKISYSLK